MPSSLGRHSWALQRRERIPARWWETLSPYQLWKAAAPWGPNKRVCIKEKAKVGGPSAGSKPFLARHWQDSTNVSGATLVVPRRASLVESAHQALPDVYEKSSEIEINYFYVNFCPAPPTPTPPPHTQSLPYFGQSQ